MQTACVIVAEWDVNMKKNGIKKGTMRIAVCGIIAALSLVFMMMTSLVPIGTYALPCLAGILISCIVVEYGYGWAIGVFCVTAVLSTLLAGDKEAVIYFIALFGYYPISKTGQFNTYSSLRYLMLPPSVRSLSQHGCCQFRQMNLPFSVFMFRGHF